MAADVAELVRLGRFPDALEGGLALLSTHTGSRGCRCRFAADLVPLAVVTEQALLTEALALIVQDDEVVYLPSRARWMTSMADAWASAWFGASGEAEMLLVQLRARKLPPADFRLLLAETELRNAPEDTEQGKAPSSDRRMIGALRRARVFSAAVGYGLALLNHAKDDTGKIRLAAVVRNLERQDPTLLEDADPPQTKTFAAALNRWSWARAVLGMARSSDDPEWPRVRLPAVARYFATVGNPLGAATAQAQLAQLHRDEGDRPAAVRAAAAALGHTESRFLTLSTLSKVKKWGWVARTACDVGLELADDKADLRLFRNFDNRCDWLGDRTTLDERLWASAEVFRTLFTRIEGQALRQKFEYLLTNALQPLRAAGAGSPLAQELVEMEREDVRAGGDPIWLARALTILADLQADQGDTQSSVVTGLNARAVFLGIGSDEAAAEAYQATQARIGGLVSAGRWADAVRMAVAFDDDTVDQVAVVRDRALAAGRTDVMEQLAAFRVELARSGDRAELVRALCHWAAARNDLTPGSGTPLLAEAVRLAEVLAAEDSHHTATLVEARVQAARYGSTDVCLDDLWRRVVAEPFQDKGLFVRLTELVAMRDKDAHATVDVLTTAANHIVMSLSAEEHWPLGLVDVDRVLRWSDTLVDLGAATSAVRLLAALTRLPLREESHEAIIRTELATALLGRGDYAAAEAELTRAVALEPGSVKAHQTLGLLRLAMGAADRARLALDHAVELAPQQEWTRCLRADAWRLLGNYDAALRDLTEVTSLLPRSEEAGWRLARVFRAIGVPEHSLRALDDAGAARSAQDWLRYQYGLALVESGDRAAAEQFFIDAVEIGSAPRRSVSWRQRSGDPNLGLYLLALGRDEDAAADCATMLEAYPGEWFARELVEDLDELAAVLPDRADTVKGIKELAMQRIA